MLICSSTNLKFNCFIDTLFLEGKNVKNFSWRRYFGFNRFFLCVTKEVGFLRVDLCSKFCTFLLSTIAGRHLMDSIECYMGTDAMQDVWNVENLFDFLPNTREGRFQIPIALKFINCNLFKFIAIFLTLYALTKNAINRIHWQSVPREIYGNSTTAHKRVAKIKMCR